MSLYVSESGPRDAPTIVFLHGNGVAGWIWRAQVEHLKESFHCIVPDLPEHGKSVGVKPFTIEDSAQLVAEIIRNRAQNSKAHVVGLAIGGQIILEMLSSYPQLVDHAIISGVLARPIYGIGLANLLMRLYMPFRNIGVMGRASMQSLGIPSEYYKEFRENLRLLTADAFAHITTENAKFTLPPGMDKVTAPLLVLAGEKEPDIVKDSARDILKAVPAADGYIVQGVGHNWELEAPDLFTRTVEAWITYKPLPKVLRPTR